MFRQLLGMGVELIEIAFADEITSEHAILALRGRQPTGFASLCDRGNRRDPRAD